MLFLQIIIKFQKQQYLYFQITNLLRFAYDRKSPVFRSTVLLYYVVHHILDEDLTDEEWLLKQIDTHNEVTSKRIQFFKNSVSIGLPSYADFLFLFLLASYCSFFCPSLIILHIIKNMN